MTMRDLVHWLFSENTINLEIGLYDFWHFLYLFIIFGGTIFLAIKLKNKPREIKIKTIRVFAYLTIGLYVADFFIMPLSDSYDGISTYKLPFNICTLMALLVPFVEFNKRFQRFKPTIVILSIVATCIWMVYPGSALGGQPPFSYIIFQTFIYHGFLFCWGILNIAYKEVTLNIKYAWKEFVAILLVFVWASFGNAVYDGEQNWFFIEVSIVPFLPDEALPFVIIPGVFIVSLLVYGVYYLILHIAKKRKKDEVVVINKKKQWKH